MGLLSRLFRPAAPAGAEVQTDGDDERERDAHASVAPKAAQSVVSESSPSRLAPTPPFPSQIPEPSADSVAAPPPSSGEAAPQNPSMGADIEERRPGELVLTVGDILPHLPTEAIKPGLHDAERVVRFHVSDLAADIAKGRASMLLSKLSELCPDLVHHPEGDAAGQEIRLPHRKLVDQLSASPAPAPAPEAEATEETKSEVPLAEMHGDLVGNSARPEWLKPAKKPANQPPPSPPSAPRAPLPRKARLQPVNPLPASTAPLTGAFAKRKESTPAATSAAPEVKAAEQPPTPLMDTGTASLSDTPAKNPPERPAVETPLASSKSDAPPPAVLTPAAATKVEPPQPAPPTPEIAMAAAVKSEQPPEATDAVPAGKQATTQQGKTEGENQRFPAATPEIPRIPEPVPAGEAKIATSAHSAPPVEEPGQVPVVPTAHPRIRPPAPPPPVLVTPAAGLREAINPSPDVPPFTGENLKSAGASSSRPPGGEWRKLAGLEKQPEAVDTEKTKEPAAPAVSGAVSQPKPNPPATAASVSSTRPEIAAGEPPVTAPHSGIVRPPPIQRPGGAGAQAVNAVPEPPVQPVPGSVASGVAEGDPKYWPVAPAQAVTSSAANPRSTYLAPRSASAPVNVAPPMPSRSLSLYSQENLQALFMTEEVLDVQSLAHHVAALPGMHACALFAGDEAAQAGDFPPEFDLNALREMGVQFVSTAAAFGGRLMGRDLENVTIQGGGFSVTLFARVGLCLCVVHRARGFLPGVREKLATVADELARGK